MNLDLLFARAADGVAFVQDGAFDEQVVDDVVHPGDQALRLPPAAIDFDLQRLEGGQAGGIKRAGSVGLAVDVEVDPEIERQILAGSSGGRRR